jgi:hypothetical protein
VSFGPLMRFVYGADFAARTVAAELSRQMSRPACENEPEVLEAAS